ncbi:hypothetical protein ACO0R3_000288 [Hanseniaspora guilliermondii]
MASFYTNGLFIFIYITTRYFLFPHLLKMFNAEQMMLQYIDVLFNTPFISYKTLKECILFTQFKNNGSNLNQMPLYVSLFVNIPEQLHFYMFALIDMLTLLYFLKLDLPHCVSTSLKTKFWIYLFNPLIFLNLIMRTQFVFTQFFIIMALYYCQNYKLNKYHVYKASISIAIATYLDIYNIGLALICLNFFKKFNQRKQSTICFITALTLLYFISYRINSNFIDNVILSCVLFKEQYPNIGLWWYFFTEMFQEYRNFFKFVFNGYSYIFVIPVFLRFKHYPLQGSVILFTWITMFKPYPTVGELGFILTAFVSWFDMNIIENKLIMGLLVMHSLVLLPVFYHLWITVGSGNSNFFYAMTLVYVIGLALVLLGMIKSLLYNEYISINCDDKNHEEDKSDKKLNLVCV